MTDSADMNAVVELAADVVSAYVSNNKIVASDLPNLIGEVQGSRIVDVLNTESFQSPPLAAAGVISWAGLRGATSLLPGLSLHGGVRFS